MAAAPVAPPATRAKVQKRHRGLVGAFVLGVILPTAIAGGYLYTRAVDQYASYVGFSVRSESAGTSTDVLGGLSSLVGVTSSSTSDTDVLFKFIQSRDLVERVDQRMNLREVWSKAPGDPIFGFRGNDSIEALVKEWERKVRIQYNDGMIDLRILAFDPQDAQGISQAILDEGTVLINELNDISREDALRYARDELERAQERLRAARQAVTEFRNEYQIVDPEADVQGQVGVVTSLQTQLAEQLVSLGLLRANAQPEDPRIAQTELRVQVIREQIDDERQKVGTNTEDVALSEVVGQYETLAVDRQFAETSYTTALAAFESARAEAVRQSRYLAPYIRPTLAQEPEFPQRGRLLAMIFGFLTLAWIIGCLAFYSLRDRR
ncbi:sugar transporter [Paracoccus sp. C2R09]|nr:sugar transporter [Paracoccus sp. C2R09]